MWEQYIWYIIVALSIIAIQAAMIGNLLLHRARRRRAEADLKESYDRTQDLAGRLITTQEAERSRIASDLHDDVNQQLAGLSIALSNVKRQLQNGGDGTVQEEITRLQQRTIDLADVIRNLSHELHPRSLATRRPGRRAQGSLRRSWLSTRDRDNPFCCSTIWTAFHRTLRSVCTASPRKRYATSLPIRARVRRTST